MWVVAIGQVTRPGAILRHRPSRPLGEFKSPHRLEPIGCLPHGCGIRVGRRPDFLHLPSARREDARDVPEREGTPRDGPSYRQTVCARHKRLSGPGGDGRGPARSRWCAL